LAELGEMALRLMELCHNGMKDIKQSCNIKDFIPGIKVKYGWMDGCSDIPPF